MRNEGHVTPVTDLRGGIALFDGVLNAGCGDRMPTTNDLLQKRRFER